LDTLLPERNFKEFGFGVASVWINIIIYIVINYEI